MSPILIFFISAIAGYITSLVFLFMKNAVVEVWSERKLKPAKRPNKNPYQGLSWAARNIMEKYEGLPVDNRPSVSMLEVVKALDVKHGKSVVNNHFSYAAHGGLYYSWYVSGRGDHKSLRCSDPKAECQFKDYYNLYMDLSNIYAAILDQKRALEIAGIQPGLDMIDYVRESLKEEASIINNVTKEVCK